MFNNWFFEYIRRPLCVFRPQLTRLHVVSERPNSINKVIQYKMESFRIWKGIMSTTTFGFERFRKVDFTPRDNEIGPRLRRICLHHICVGAPFGKVGVSISLLVR